MAVPSETTWAVNQRLTAALLNSNVRDAVNFLISVPRAQVYQDTTGTSLPDSTFTSVTFNKESFDSDTLHTGSSAQLICVTAGTYMLSGAVAFVANATGARNVRWMVNGVLVGPTVRVPNPSATQPATVSAPDWMVTLAVGNTVELQGSQNSGGALLTSVTATDFSYMSGLWVST